MNTSMSSRPFLIRLYERNRKIRNLVLRLGLAPSLRRIPDLKSSRIVEYPWIYMNLDSPDIHKRVLDVGSVGSVLPVILFSMGYEVWCIDVRKYEYESLIPNLKCVIGDIRKTVFEAGLFDYVIAVSTIEHIGCGLYGEWLDSEGDIKAVKEITRILSETGVLLATLPFGAREVTSTHRVYDQLRLQKILEGFNVDREDYYIRNTSGFWLPCTKDALTKVRSPILENGIVCIRATKV